MGITEILRMIWLFSANKIKSSESFSKQLTQLIITAHNCHTINQKIIAVRRSQVDMVLRNSNSEKHTLVTEILFIFL